MSPEGKLLWSRSAENVTSDIEQPLVDRDGTIYAASNGVLALTPAGDVLWEVSLPESHCTSLAPTGDRSLVVRCGPRVYLLADDN